MARAGLPLAGRAECTRRRLLSPKTTTPERTRAPQTAFELSIAIPTMQVSRRGGLARPSLSPMTGLPRGRLAASWQPQAAEVCLMAVGSF
jgi:hypothetical protein